MMGRDTGSDSAPPPPLAGEGRGGGKPRWLVKPSTRKKARTLRANLTDAERIMWRELRGHRLQGVAFRRQTPVGPYIADFVAHSAKLIVEIDGGQHFEAEHARRDARRTAFLSERGFRVLRFSNLDVMQNREGVLTAIAEALGAAPSLSLPRKRGREEKTADAGQGVAAVKRDAAGEDA